MYLPGKLAGYVLHSPYKLYARIKKIEGPYEGIIPSATYAPWKEDSVFLNTYKIIRSHTLVNKLQCYGLWSLVEQSSKLAGNLIEIGVWRGGTGALIAKQAELCGITETVYLCDTFTGVVKASSFDQLYQNGRHKDTSVDIVEKLLYKRFGLNNVKILTGIFPDQTAHYIEDKMFRFCHIDVDVYESGRQAIK